ncbi:type II secretion system protein GspM [Sphingomonas phyllosphaerae]|uniref:type II secretion system protein GspM n=1 Tax=Sphingomonas phyllosphaerae TaxID=257003 RepID=UPI002413C447|nr:type II secretion system protein GspM [Sphingomonas phyllosphaerae]
MNAARAWFESRSLRERRLIAVMAVLLIVTLVWAAVILPVRNGLSSSRARYTDAVVRLGAAQSGLAQVKGLQRRGATALGGSLADVVRARADAAGLALASLDVVAPDQVRTSITSARAGALMRWVAGLEQEGILIDSLSVTGSGAGSVTAQLSLRQRGE